MIDSYDEILTTIKKLISDPQHWCQYNLAEDKTGEPCDILSSEAYAYCSLGAVDKITIEHNMRPSYAVWDYLNKAALKLGYNSISILNDRCDHSKVMEMFDLAIEASKEWKS